MSDLTLRAVRLEDVEPGQWYLMPHGDSWMIVRCEEHYGKRRLWTPLLQRTMHPSQINSLWLLEKPLEEPGEEPNAMRDLCETLQAVDAEEDAKAAAMRARAPALLAMTGEFGEPSQCCDCPFASVHDAGDPPNPSDPGEGWYDCALLDRKRVWGESPVCEPGDWRRRGREELARLVEGAR